MERAKYQSLGEQALFKKRLIIGSIFFLMLAGAGGWYYKPRPGRKPLPLILIVGDQYNLGGENQEDRWGYRKPLQDLLGAGKYDFVGNHRIPSGASRYDPDISAVFYQKLNICKLDLEKNLKTHMTNAPRGSWVIIFSGAWESLRIGTTTKFAVSEISGMVKLIHEFDPGIGIIVPRLPPANVTSFDRKIVRFNNLILFSLQGWWYQKGKKNLFIPDLHALFTGIPDWKQKTMAKTVFPSPFGWRVIAETFSDIISGGKEAAYEITGHAPEEARPQYRVWEGKR
ncbi:MAG: hypothetical protein ACE5GM_04500, partial [bacterium]